MITKEQPLIHILSVMYKPQNSQKNNLTNYPKRQTSNPFKHIYAKTQQKKKKKT